MSTSARFPCTVAGVLLSFGSCVAPCGAAEADRIAELERAIDLLRAENRALSQRLSTLEGGKAPSETSTPAPAAPASTAALEQRVKELEMGKVAQEDAVRTIIRDSVSTLGSKINESVSFSGTLDAVATHGRDFSGERKNTLGFSGLQLEFDVQTNEWSAAQIRLESLDGRNLPVSTVSGQQTTIDRVRVETAYITLGNLQRFPVSLSAGRMVLPFGISTGRPVADTLSIASPLTVEVFETIGNTAMLNIAFPTPPLGPPTPPVIAPPVRPMVLYPAVSAFGRSLGYEPVPTRPKPLPPVSFTPPQSPYSAGLLLYEGPTTGGIRRNVGATIGYHAKGHCGKPYDELAGSGLCPWAINADINYNSSIFSSRFLDQEYQGFLDQIGRIPAYAASVKGALGPFSLVAEWNGAGKHARFVDDAGRSIGIKPSAWQVSLGWQLGWNPWVQEIGAQGTYLALGYSQSRDLAGAVALVNGAPTRVGFVPKRRVLLTAGEWVMDGLRVGLELSRNWDYSLAEGGTGKSVNGVTASLTYVW